MFIRVYDVTYVEIQFNHSKLCDFIKFVKMVKNTINFIGGFSSIKQKQKQKQNAKETRDNMSCRFAGMTSLS